MSVSPTPSPTVAVPVVPVGWRALPVPIAGVSVPLPPEWVAVPPDAVADPGARAELERDYEGAEGMFAALDAQEGRARIVLLAVDGSARGTDRFASNLAVLAIEPRVPGIGLGVATDFALSALDRTLDFESPVERESVQLGVGQAQKISFDHRLAGRAGDPGAVVRLDAALVTTADRSFLVMLNREAEASPGGSAAPSGDAVSLETILAGLEPLP